MQHKFVLPFVLLLFLGVFAAITQAQDEPAAQPVGQPISVDGLPKQMIDGVSELTADSILPQSLLTPLSMSADPPGDTCEGAPLLVVTPGENDGIAADISDASEESTDPELACLLGKPSRDKGYRTVWYQLAALPYNRVILDTFSSGYDTVVSVYRGTCDNLVPLDCNDDTVEFTSEVNVQIDPLPEPPDGEEEEKYYVQIADWGGGLVPDPTLRLSVAMVPVDSKWSTIISKPANPIISRHAVVSHGQNVYVIGGQTGGLGLPQISNRLLRLDTNEDRWWEMQQIPGVGYSNSTAVVLNDTIYLPSGFNGNDLGYDGLHWAYNISGNFWKDVASIPASMLPDDLPFAWAAAVAHPSQLRYYLTGGMTSTKPFVETASVSSEVYKYEQADDSWTQLKPMKAKRYAHTAGWIENKGICVAGGLDTGVDDGEPTLVLHPSVECYMPGVSTDWEIIGEMQIPRYGAGSAVGPDGKWYIFGGRGEFHNEIAQTEIYNPATNSFSVLEASYDLGTYRSMPARFWPRGAIVGNKLWVVGGSIQNGGEEAVGAIDRLYIPSDRVFSPYVIGNYSDAERPDDSFATARHMGFGGWQNRNFDQQRDFFDFYFFDVTAERRVNIDLEVPENNNFDLELYGQNKLLWGSSTDPRNGDDEHISLVLQPRRYFIKVSRVYPTSQPDKGAYYTLKLN